MPLPAPRPMDLGEPRTVDPGIGARVSPPAQKSEPVQAALPPQPAPQPAPEPTPAPEARRAPPAESATELPALCAALVEQKTIEMERAPPVTERPGCPLPVPVRLTAVRLADGNLVSFAPAAIMRCEAAVAVATWVREDIGPAVAALGTRLEEVKVADSYSCRPRNRKRGAKISEHGTGNAFDTYGFVLADKRVFDVKGQKMPTAFEAALKESACARFTTVLGPGSDGYHEDHVHVDLAVRRLDIRLCKWRIKLPEAPAVARVPEPKPAAGGDDAAAPEDAAAATEEAAAAERHAAEPDDVPYPPRRPASLPPRRAQRG
ncbi:extensin family protein [Aquabacter spiritensis]|uniref:extensin family protein n=1 Tax=Aquabacter spiritensis TaxID=933073 RepID=UPI0014045E86|nr:extensin family protein [Aquabacter spiritensis]